MVSDLARSVRYALIRNLEPLFNIIDHNALRLLFIEMRTPDSVPVWLDWLVHAFENFQSLRMEQVVVSLTWQYKRGHVETHREKWAGLDRVLARQPFCRLVVELERIDHAFTPSTDGVELDAVQFRECCGFTSLMDKASVMETVSTYSPLWGRVLDDGCFAEIFQ